MLSRLEVDATCPSIHLGFEYHGLNDSSRRSNLGGDLRRDGGAGCGHVDDVGKEKERSVGRVDKEGAKEGLMRRGEERVLRICEEYGVEESIAKARTLQRWDADRSVQRGPALYAW